MQQPNNVSAVRRIVVLGTLAVLLQKLISLHLMWPTSANRSTAACKTGQVTRHQRVWIRILFSHSPVSTSQNSIQWKITTSHVLSHSYIKIRYSCCHDGEICDNGSVSKLTCQPWVCSLSSVHTLLLFCDKVWLSYAAIFDCDVFLGS